MKLQTDVKKRDLLNPQFPPDKRKNGQNYPFQSRPVDSLAPPYGSKGEGQVKQAEVAPRAPLHFSPSNKTFPSKLNGAIYSTHCSCFTTHRWNKRRSPSCLGTTVITNVASVNGDLIKSIPLVALPFTLFLTNQSRRACVVTRYTTNETHCPIRGRGGSSLAMENAMSLAVYLSNIMRLYAVKNIHFQYD